MLKSIFAKYVTTFMALLLVSFLLLLVIVNSVIRNDTISDERRDMQGVSVSVAAHLYELYAAGDSTDFAAFIRDKTEASVPDAEGSTVTMDRLLRAIMTNYEDMTVYVTDTCGGFIFSTGKNASPMEPGTVILPEDYFAALAEKNAGSAASRYALAVSDIAQDEEVPEGDGVFLPAERFGNQEEKLVYVLPIRADGGDCVGHVAVTSTAETRTGLINTTLRSVAVAGLWIMLAALVALYFTTERITGPLREMSRASKKLMVGQFDVRVRVHGKDEVAELAAAFNQMAGALESLDSMRNSFVANVSHDLRTPMTTISGFIDGILDGVIPPEEHEHYLRVVADEVRRLSRLVTALLDVSRLQAGDRKFDMKPFDVCEMGRQILISFEQKIEAKQLDVEFDCEEERMFVHADRDAIYQILYNICDNAVKFAYEGGKLRLSFAWSSWSVNGVHRTRKAIVKVFNEGQGIPPEDLPYVFERFYKSDKSRSLDKTGVGLGMFIAKTIIDAHNETISVSGEYGQNCEFTFTLARTDPPRLRTNNPTGGNL